MKAMLTYIRFLSGTERVGQPLDAEVPRRFRCPPVPAIRCMDARSSPRSALSATAPTGKVSGWSHPRPPRPAALSFPALWVPTVSTTAPAWRARSRRAVHAREHAIWHDIRRARRVRWRYVRRHRLHHRSASPHKSGWRRTFKPIAQAGGRRLSTVHRPSRRATPRWPWPPILECNAAKHDGLARGDSPDCSPCVQLRDKPKQGFRACTN